MYTEKDIEPWVSRICGDMELLEGARNTIAPDVIDLCAICGRVNRCITVKTTAPRKQPRRAICIECIGTMWRALHEFCRAGRYGPEARESAMQEDCQPRPTWFMCAESRRYQAKWRKQ